MQVRHQIKLVADSSCIGKEDQYHGRTGAKAQFADPIIVYLLPRHRGYFSKRFKDVPLVLLLQTEKALLEQRIV
ncbi:MAG: hypothetical protein KQJ78_25310 [Deltaproteobacteria bacterium]|nr:hypothetical protein [Deltaproteobacteria bacterium]